MNKPLIDCIGKFFIFLKTEGNIIQQANQQGYYLNDSSEERRNDEYILPPDEEGGVRVQWESVQPRHQVQVPHLHIWMIIITCASLNCLEGWC